MNATRQSQSVYRRQEDDVYLNNSLMANSLVGVVPLTDHLGSSGIVSCVVSSYLVHHPNCAVFTGHTALALKYVPLLDSPPVLE